MNKLNTLNKNVVYLFDHKVNPSTFKLCLYGNVEELVIGYTDIVTAHMFADCDPTTWNDLAFNQWDPGDRYVDGWDDSTHRLPAWANLSEQFHHCGLIVDDDFRAVVEDFEGNEIHDLTMQLRKQAGIRYANDNGRPVIYEVGAYNGLDTSEGCSAENANVGLFNARSFERGVFHYTFETDGAFDPRLLEVPLQDLTDHHLTAEATYNGIPAIDFDVYRWTLNPPRAIMGYAKI